MHVYPPLALSVKLMTLLAANSKRALSVMTRNKTPTNDLRPPLNNLATINRKTT